MKRLIAALAALAVAVPIVAACDPTPPPAVVNPIPPVVRFVERTLDWFWGQEKNPNPPLGDGKWHPRQVDCAVIAHNEQVNSAGIMPVTPLDGYAFLFPEQWFMECFPFRPSTNPNTTAVRTLKGSGAPNVPSMSPTIQCKFRPPFIITVGTYFECYIADLYWAPQARTDPAYLQVVAS